MIYKPLKHKGSSDFKKLWLKAWPVTREKRKGKKRWGETCVQQHTRYPSPPSSHTHLHNGIILSVGPVPRFAFLVRVWSSLSLMKHVTQFLTSTVRLPHQRGHAWPGTSSSCSCRAQKAGPFGSEPVFQTEGSSATRMRLVRWSWPERTWKSPGSFKNSS